LRAASSRATRCSSSTPSPPCEWSVNAWAGRVVRITGGTGAGQVRRIASNIATELTIDTPWTTIPDATSNYQVLFIVGRVSTRPEYDRNSRLTFSVEDDTDTARTFYDGANRVVLSVDPEGNTVETAYDDNSNVIETRETDLSQVPGIAPEVFLTTSFYDSLNRVQQTVDNLGQTQYYRYDSRDNLAAMADAEGPVTGTTVDRRALVGSAVASPPSIIDDGDAGFTTTSGFFPFPGQGYQDDVSFAAPGSGAESATWTFAGLTPGLYRVAATWSAEPNRATDARSPSTMAARPWLRCSSTRSSPPTTSATPAPAGNAWAVPLCSRATC
jgi:YD repeat-containing protein